MREITPRRLAAAKRAIKRQKEKYSLFAWAGTAVQEGFVDSSPIDRIEKHDAWFEKWNRARILRHYKEIKAALLSIPVKCRHHAIQTFRHINYPADYFPEFVRKKILTCPRLKDCIKKGAL